MSGEVTLPWPREGSDKVSRPEKEGGGALEEGKWSLQPCPPTPGLVVLLGVQEGHMARIESPPRVLCPGDTTFRESRGRQFAAPARMQRPPAPPSITLFHAPHSVRLPETTVHQLACPPTGRVLSIALFLAPWAPPGADWPSGSQPIYSQDSSTLLNIAFYGLCLVNTYHLEN